ncbi:AraC family transcriptional regulator [Ruminococcus sp.]|uniref:AraC family transcriptional regulator n=1 Tax=Ruminococcus sp. TaxID=41978 RepID=UPI0025DFA49C|nr:AraC family transcriptional regulator [Ruminococcus sp.]
MIVGAIGYNYQHKKDFVMDCPEGPGSPLMLLIKEPSVFIVDGKEYSVNKNSFVLLSPHTPVKYYAQGDVYTDDWLYFNYEKEEQQKFGELAIPSDEIIYLGNIDELSQLIRSIAYEHQSLKEFHEDIEKHYLEIFLLKLSRLIRHADSDSCIVTDRNSRFMQLRSSIYAMPEDITDVDSLAENMGLSRSGFQHLYKKLFGVNIMSDIINARMERAKQLLITTNLSIKEIAERCGYSNEYGFMKRFKMQFGKTPTQYRNIV